MLVGNAHLVQGNTKDIGRACDFLETSGLSIRGNPDAYVEAYTQFGADEARALSARASLRPVMGSSRVFVVATPSMTKEAQNALLKTIEEPQANALFILITPTPSTLLATFQSRCQTLVLPPDSTSTSTLDAGNFLKAPPEKRLDMLKPLLEKGEDDKRDIGAILEFLSSLERHIARTSERKALEPLYAARKYATDKGALLKPLLEQMALLMPRM